MAGCNDCWCENFDKSRGNCNQCEKKDNERSKPDLKLILKQRAIKQMELDERSKKKGQNR